MCAVGVRPGVEQTADGVRTVRVDGHAHQSFAQFVEGVFAKAVSDQRRQHLGEFAFFQQIDRVFAV